MGDDKYNQEFECSFNAAVEGSYYGKLINDLEEKGRLCDITRDDLCRTYVAWDLVVEAYDDGDLLEELSEHNFDLKKTIQSLQDTIDLRKQLMEEHQAEARQSY